MRVEPSPVTGSEPEPPAEDRPAVVGAPGWVAGVDDAVVDTDVGCVVGVAVVGGGVDAGCVVGVGAVQSKCTSMPAENTVEGPIRT